VRGQSFNHFFLYEFRYTKYGLHGNDEGIDKALGTQLTVQDINRHDNPDPLRVIVSHQDKIIYQFDLPDDGYISAADPATGPREVNLYLTNIL